MSLQLTSDAELIDNYLCGCHASLEVLIHRHKRRIFSYILMVVKDKHLAEDIFQDTFIKVVNTLRNGTYVDQGRFLSWVLRIAHNLMIDHFRISKRIPYMEKNQEMDIFDTIHTEEYSVEEKMVIDQIHKNVRALIEFLPPDQKEVIIMRHYYDMSFKEIAEEIDVSINTALGRMRYGLKNLRRLIEKKELIMEP